MRGRFFLRDPGEPQARKGRGGFSQQAGRRRTLTLDGQSMMTGYPGGRTCNPIS
jgi:hypothetical protein